MVLRAVDRRRHARPHPGHGTPADTAAPRSRSRPLGADHRPPVGEGDRKRGDVGYDAGQQIKRTKRFITVDTNGLLVRVVVLSARVQDWDGLRDLCGVAQPVSPRVTAGWVEAAVTAGVAAVQDRFGWELLVVTKPPDQKGFVVQPRRRVVERTFAWLTDCRRLAKDYEGYTETSEAVIYLAMIQLMLRRLAPDASHRPWKAANAA